jgi:excisionase family DNA binding protein
VPTTKRSKRAHGVVPKHLPSPDAALVATPYQAAPMLGMSVSSVIKLVRRGELRRLRGIRRILIPKSSIHEYLIRDGDDR